MKKITLLLLVCLTVVSFKVKAIDLPITGVMAPTVASGWTYVSNDPVNYPNPGFYTTAGALGLKLNFENMGLISPDFTAVPTVFVKLNVNALNQNTKTGANTNFFTITGLNASGNVVATAYLTSVVKGDNEVSISGTDVVKVKILMTGYPYDGAKYCNVNLASVTISSVSTGVNNTEAQKLNVWANGNKVSFEANNGEKVEVFNSVGQKVLAQTTTEGKNELVVNNKGVTIVRVGNRVGKVVL